MLSDFVYLFCGVAESFIEGADVGFQGFVALCLCVRVVVVPDG